MSFINSNSDLSWIRMGNDLRNATTPRESAAVANRFAIDRGQRYAAANADPGRQARNAAARDNWNAGVQAVRNFPNGDVGAGGGGGGGGYSRPAPLVLPRMQLPAPELLAQQAYLAVGAATAPYIQAIQQLATQRAEGNQAITAADREARSQGKQIQSDWRSRTAAVEGNIAGVYREALSGLAAVVSANNQSMMNAGFQPSDAGQMEALGRLSGLGASAREAALVRQQLGADAYRDARSGTAAVTQAGRSTLAATYGQVLGSLRAQQAAAEAAARMEQFNREMALRQEIDRINYDASVQEAVANR